MSRVHVGNLDQFVTEKDIEDAFRLYGVIRSPPGYAIILFDKERDAISAIRAYLDGKKGWSVNFAHGVLHPPYGAKRIDPSPFYEYFCWSSLRHGIRRCSISPYRSPSPPSVRARRLCGSPRNGRGTREAKAIDSSET